MQRLSTMDVGHTQASDHRILRMPPQVAGPAEDPARGATPETKLVRFPPVEEISLRGLALAWTSLAGAGSNYAFEQSQKLLPEALAQNPDDPDLLAAVGFSEQLRGLTDQAREHYEHALRVQPLALDAAANLGLIEANAGHLDRAAALWKSAFERAPGRSSLGINLARAWCLSGHGEQAKATIGRVLEFNPDFSTARGMLKQLENGEVTCDASEWSGWRNVEKRYSAFSGWKRLHGETFALEKVRRDAKEQQDQGKSDIAELCGLVWGEQDGVDDDGDGGEDEQQIMRWSYAEHNQVDIPRIVFLDLLNSLQITIWQPLKSVDETELA
jgi:tetratricopeptide (TPR) repeat protein